MDNKIIEVCKGSKSMLEASRKLNLNFNTFKRKAIKLGCYETNQNWNKGKNIFNDSRVSKNRIEEIFCENSRIKIFNHKENLKEILGYACNKCGINNWLESELILEIDHINGINNDNRIENLRFLCPNCHSQTETFRGKNIKMNKNEDGFFKYTKKEFLESVNTSKNIREVCIKLNLTPKGGNYETIKNKINEYGIELNKEIKDKVNKECKCGSKILKESKMCQACFKFSLRKVERPPYEELKREIKEFGYKSTGKKYNVSDNCIRKWIKYYDKIKNKAL